MKRESKTHGKALWIILILLLVVAAVFSLRMAFTPEASQYRYQFKLETERENLDEGENQRDETGEGQSPAMTQEQVCDILEGRLQALGMQGQAQGDGTGVYTVSFTVETAEDSESFSEAIFDTFFGMQGRVYLSAGEERLDLRPCIQTAVGGADSLILNLTPEGQQTVSDLLSRNQSMTVFVDDWALGEPEASTVLATRQIVLTDIEERTVDYLLALIQEPALPGKMSLVQQVLISGRKIDTGWIEDIAAQIRQFGRGFSQPDRGFFQIQGDITVPVDQTVPLELFFYDASGRTIFEQEEITVSEEAREAAAANASLKKVRFDNEQIQVEGYGITPVEEISDQLTCYSLSMEIRLPAAGEYTVTQVIVNEGEEIFPVGNLLIRCADQNPVFEVQLQEDILDTSGFQCRLTSQLTTSITVEDINCGNLEQFAPEKQIIYNGSIGEASESRRVRPGGSIDLLINFTGGESDLYYTSPIVVYRLQGEEALREYRIWPFGYCLSGQLLPDFQQLYESRYQ